MLGVGCWTLDSRHWTLNATLWTLVSGHWTLSLTVLEQNLKLVSDSPWLNYWKSFVSKSLRTSWSRLFCRGYSFWRDYFQKFYINVKCYVIKECQKKSLLSEILLHYKQLLGLFRCSCPQPSIFFNKYYYTTTNKLKITITRHQKILVAPGNNKKCKSSWV